MSVAYQCTNEYVIVISVKNARSNSKDDVRPTVAVFGRGMLTSASLGSLFTPASTESRFQHRRRSRLTSYKIER